MRNKLFLLLLGIVLLFSIYPIFHTGIWKSHDGEQQIARLAMYTKSMQDGQFLVRWADKLNYSYGSPLFIFFYPLPYYVGSLTHILGLSLEVSFKILMAGSLLLSFFTFYFWISQLVAKRNALLASLVYVLGPYHLLDMYVRGDIGELLALAILPSVFYFVEKTIQYRTTKSILAAGIVYALLILSHNGVSLMFSPIILLYVVLRSYMVYKKINWRLSLIFIFGLSLSAFFWMPALYEQKYILSLQIFDQYYKTNFPMFRSLFFSPWGFGADINSIGGLSPQIGIVGWLSFFISLPILLKKKVGKNEFFLFGIGVFLLGIFFALPISTMFYEHISLFRKFQFPWRFLVFSLFGSALLAGLVLEKLRSTLLYITFAIGISLSILFIVVSGYAHHDDLYYSRVQDTFYHGEAIPIWTAGNEGTFPKSSFELIGGEGEIHLMQRNATKHVYTVYAKTPISLLDNTIYFPGWNVYVDKRKAPIQFQDINHRGLITFTVPEGKHIVSAVFNETLDRIVADAISVISLLFVIIFFGLQRLFKLKK